MAGLVSAQLRIVHHTGFRYSGGATASFNEVRMIPRSTHEQQLLQSRVDITPVPWSYSYTDYWGTSVTAFEVFERHESLEVTATSVIDVRRAPDANAGLGWAELESDPVKDRYCEFLLLGERVQPADDLMERVQSARALAATPRELAEQVVGLINAEVAYVFGSTSVHTRAADAWQQRSGVCQDMAHLVIGSLRSVGVPARYVSGYTMPKRDAELGVPYAGESHAWIQYWDGRWVGVDPTNNVHPGDLHVEVAMGRDYADVTPLAGIFTGSPTSDVFVSVEMTRLT